MKKNDVYLLRSPNPFLKTGNGIISPISRPRIKIFFLQNIHHFYQVVKIQFYKQEMELCKQEIDLFLPFINLGTKKAAYEGHTMT